MSDDGMTPVRPAGALRPPAPQPGRAELESAARGFEAYLVGEMLRRAASGPPGLLDGGQAGAMYREMLHQELAKSAVKGRGLGVADAIVRGALHGVAASDATGAAKAVPGGRTR